MIKSATRTCRWGLGDHINVAVLGRYHVVHHVFIDALEAQIVVACIVVAGVTCMGRYLPAVGFWDVRLGHIIAGGISSSTLSLINLLF